MIQILAWFTALTDINYSNILADREVMLALMQVNYEHLIAGFSIPEALRSHQSTELTFAGIGISSKKLIINSRLECTKNYCI